MRDTLRQTTHGSHRTPAERKTKPAQIPIIYTATGCCMEDGPLNSTKLDQTLHNLGITSLIVTGLTTKVCVTQTARQTADLGFCVLIVEDACTTLSEEMHRAALETFRLAFGRVRKTEDVTRLVSAASG